MSTNLLRSLLLDSAESFSAANTDWYHVPTGAALHSMGIPTGTIQISNFTLRGSAGKDGITMLGGISEIADCLPALEFDSELLDALGEHYKMPKAFLNYLRGQPFGVSLDIMRDGDMVAPNGVFGRLAGDPIVAKWLDTPMLNIIRLASSVATKAARLQYACDDGLQQFGMDPVMWADNAMRRPNDPMGLITAKYALMGGAYGTSNIRAAFGLSSKVAGTMDHFYLSSALGIYFMNNTHKSWENPDHVGEGLEYAFEKFMDAVPENGTLLLDLTNLEQGLQAAINVLKRRQPKAYAVRVDSAQNLANTINWVNEQLHKNGLSRITVAVSGGMKASTILALRRAGVKFASCGVGEYLQYGGEARGSNSEPPVNVEMVAKAGALIWPDGRIVRQIKISEIPEKASRGGKLDRVRLMDTNGHYVGDVEIDMLLMKNLGDGVLRDAMQSYNPEIKKVRRFEAGTPFMRPIRPLFDGRNLLDPTALDFAHAKQNFQNTWKRMPKSAKGWERGDGTMPAYVAGIEFGHFEANEKMARLNQPISFYP